MESEQKRMYVPAPSGFGPLEWLRHRELKQSKRSKTLVFRNRGLSPRDPIFGKAEPDERDRCQGGAQHC